MAENCRISIMCARSIPQPLERNGFVKMLNINELKDFFSSRNIASVSRGDLTLVNCVAKCYQESLPPYFTVGDVFDYCFRVLIKSYRNEYCLKNLIARNIFLSRHGGGGATMFNEFRVGGNKADCVIVNGLASCYEIKTDYDNLGRLSTQIESYLKIFDKVNVVASDKYLDSIVHAVPDEVGVVRVSKGGGLKAVRPAKQIVTPVDTEVLIRSLRKSEYIALVEDLGGVIPEVGNTQIFRVCCNLLGEFDSDKVRRSFRRVIKKSRPVNREFLYSLPSSLVGAGIESDLSVNSKVRLIENLKLTLSKEALCISQYLKGSSMS